MSLCRSEYEEWNPPFDIGNGALYTSIAMEGNKPHRMMRNAARNRRDAGIHLTTHYGRGKICGQIVSATVRAPNGHVEEMLKNAIRANYRKQNAEGGELAEIPAGETVTITHQSRN